VHSGGTETASAYGQRPEGETFPDLEEPMADEVHIHEQPPREPSRDVHVHNQAPAPRDGGGPGLIIGLVAVVLIVVVFWFMFTRGGDGRSIVPEQIDIDVNVPSAPAPQQPAPPQPQSPPAGGGGAAPGGTGGTGG
jgi:hypothetical protein